MCSISSSADESLRANGVWKHSFKPHNFGPVARSQFCLGENGNETGLDHWSDRQDWIATGALSYKPGLSSSHFVRRETLETKRFVNLGADLIIGDLLESHSVEQALDGTEFIVHLAAFFRGATPEQSHSVNHTATVDLARRALDRGVRRFVFASTALVYGPGKEPPVRETETPNCSTPYPLAKWAAEKALLDLHRDDGLDLRILQICVCLW